MPRVRKPRFTKDGKPWITGKKARPIEERIREYSSHTNEKGCWLWMSTLDRDGYGRIGVGDRSREAHRVSYECFIGPIPERMVIDHLCGVRSCVNPEHLKPATPRENVLSGLIGQRRETITECPYGHPYDDENSGYDEERHRYCKKCKYLSKVEYDRTHPDVKKAQNRRTYLRRKERGLTVRPEVAARRAALALASEASAEPMEPACQLQDRPLPLSGSEE